MSGCPTCGCTCKQPELSFKHIACASAACRKCRDADVALVVAAYRDFHPRFRGGGPGTKEYRVIAERLADGFSVSELYAAIQGMHRTPHNMGMNERGQKYLGLELCMRSGSQVTRFAEAPLAPAPMTKATTGTALMLANLEAELQAEKYELVASDLSTAGNIRAALAPLPDATPVGNINEAPLALYERGGQYGLQPQQRRGGK